eukprot:1374319-Amorphochlora_amoeboformis.AAC.1
MSHPGFAAGCTNSPPTRGLSAFCPCELPLPSIDFENLYLEQIIQAVWNLVVRTSAKKGLSRRSDRYVQVATIVENR